jgi:hypothetical protein
MEISSIMKRKLFTIHLLLLSALPMMLSCEGPAGLERGGRLPLERSLQMPNGSYEYPNYSMVETSPQLDRPGVAIRLVKGTQGLKFDLEEPIILSGSYCATDDIVTKSEGRPLASVMLIAIRRDDPDGWMSPVLDVSNLAPSQPPIDELEEEEIEEEEEDEEGSLDFGYFNLDLREFFEFPKEPGQYWVMAAFGDYISERLLFEVVEK